MTRSRHSIPAALRCACGLLAVLILLAGTARGIELGLCLCQEAVAPSGESCCPDTTAEIEISTSGLTGTALVAPGRDGARCFELLLDGGVADAEAVRLAKIGNEIPTVAPQLWMVAQSIRPLVRPWWVSCDPEGATAPLSARVPLRI